MMAGPGGPTIGSATGPRASAPAGQRSARWGAVQGKTLEIFTQGLLVLVLPRLLGPAAFGRLTLGLAIVTLGTVAISLGAPSAFARFLPAEPPARRAGVARAMTARLVRLRGLQLLAAGAIGAVVLLLAPARFTPADAALVFVALAIEVVSLLGAQVVLGMGRTRLWSFRLAARNVALLLAVPLLLYAAGERAVLAGLVLSSAAGLAVAGWTGLRLVSRAEAGAVIPDGALSYGAVAGLSVVMWQATYRGPVLATSVLGHSAIQTGYAALAGSIAVAAMLAIRELFTVSLPELVEAWEVDRARAERTLRRVGWRVEAALLPAALLAVPVLDRAITLLAGPDFASAAVTLVPLLALLPLLPLSALGWQGAALRLRPDLALRIDAAAAVAFVAAAAVLVPAAGAAGATSALALAALVSASLYAWVLPESVTPRFLLVAAAGAAGVFALAGALGIIG